MVTSNPHRGKPALEALGAQTCRSGRPSPIPQGSRAQAATPWMCAINRVLERRWSRLRGVFLPGSLSCPLARERVLSLGFGVERRPRGVRAGGPVLAGEL